MSCYEAETMDRSSMGGDIVEILCLHTHLLNETFALQEIAQELTAQNHMIAGAVNDFITCQS